MRLLSYNIRYGGRGREAELAAVIAACSADVVVLQEAIDPSVVEQMADRTGMRAFGARPGQSVGFLARESPRRVEWQWPPSARHAYLDLTPAGSAWRIFGIHLRAIHARWTERRRVLDVRTLLRALPAPDDVPHVLVGDFNTLPPGERLEVGRLPLRLRPFVWLSGGRIEWQVVRTLESSGYDDAWTCAAARGPGPTFPAWGAYLRLDYVFTPRALADRIVACRAVTDPPGVASASDHLPLLVDLNEP